jgi:hypothetical protein
MKTVAEKIYDIYFDEVINIVYVACAGGISIIIPPIVGISLGIALLFAQAYIPQFI